VHVFVRKSSLKANEEKRVQTLLAKPNVTLHYNTEVKEIKGTKDKLTSVALAGAAGRTSDFLLDGLFLAIGSKPNSSLFKGALKLDAEGYIVLTKDQQTSLEGIYAIGDIVDPVYKQAISAAGDGAKAALQAQQFLSDRTHGLAVKKSLSIPKVSSRNEVIEIVSLEQFQRELKSDIPVVVDFYATWCGPCKKISPVLESFAGQLNGKVKFLKVNVDKLFEISSTYNIRAMPTVLLLDEGTEVDRKVGTDQITDLLKQLQSQKGDLMQAQTLSGPIDGSL
jgi:thioredoxin reductase (NADPH)